MTMFGQLPFGFFHPPELLAMKKTPYNLVSPLKKDGF